MGTQEFRRAKNKVFLELFEPCTDLFRLFFAVVGKRPALARIVAAFRMAQHKNHAFIVLDAFINILNIDKLIRIRINNKVSIFFNSVRLVPCLGLSVIRKEFARKRTTAHFAILRRSRIAHDILQAIRNRRPALLFVTDKAFARLRHIVVLRSIEIAGLVLDKEYFAIGTGIASREFEFRQIEILNVFFKLRNLAQLFFDSFPKRNKTVLYVVRKRPVRNRNASAIIIPLAILCNIGSNCLEGLRKIAIGTAGTSLQQNRCRQKRRSRFALIRNMDILGQIKINRLQMEYLPHIIGGVKLRFFKRDFLLAQQGKSAFRFKRRQQIQVENLTGRRIAQSLERNRRRLAVRNIFDFTFNGNLHIRLRQFYFLYLVRAVFADFTRIRNISFFVRIGSIQLH